MKAFTLSAIPFAGRDYGPGIIDVTEAEFHALAQRGAVRPATADEIQQAAGPATLERADAPRDTEPAAAERRASRRVRSTTP